jgi:PKHD-type hydroxylase
MVRDATDRSLLFDLDQAIQALAPELDARDPRLLSLTGVYHNLLRRHAGT